MNILFVCAGRRTYLLKYFMENMSAEDKVVANDMQHQHPHYRQLMLKFKYPLYDPKYIDITLTSVKNRR